MNTDESVTAKETRSHTRGTGGSNEGILNVGSINTKFMTVATFGTEQRERDPGRADRGL